MKIIGPCNVKHIMMLTIKLNVYLYQVKVITVITVFLEMPVPSQGHYGYHSFPVVDLVCLYTYEF
jgi:hypothetical protein